MRSFPYFTKKCYIIGWCQFKISRGIDSKNQILWNNKKILVGKKPVFYHNWYNASNTKISDMLNQNQEFLKWYELAIRFNLNTP